jgi:transcriptional accessory protein Tex/SPT6
MNIFEQATRQALRFSSNRGELSTEQLWDLPLTKRDGFDLDTIAKTVNAQLKTLSEESFVTKSQNPAKDSLELKLEILKHIIAVKLKEAEDRRNAAERATERQKLLDILAEKQAGALKELSVEDIQKRLAELQG